MPLQFQVEIAAAVDRAQAVDDLSRARYALLCECGSQRPLITACQTDQSCGEFFQIFKCRCALCFCSLTHLEARDELAEVLIGGLRCAGQQETWRLMRELMRQPRRRSEAAAEG